MEKMKFDIAIDAPRDKVWNVLWNDDTYRKWTSVFSEGSHAVTDWKEGSKVLFLSATGEGMVSRIETSKPNEYMSIEHLGFVKDGVEVVDTEDVRKWAGAHENYLLQSVDGKTKLNIEMDVTDEMKEYMEKAWPSALSRVKDLSENSN